MCEQKAYPERKKLRIQKYLDMCGRGLNPKKMVGVQNICQKWKEGDEISENVNFEATDIWVRDFTVILMLKNFSLTEVYMENSCCMTNFASSTQFFYNF